MMNDGGNKMNGGCARVAAGLRPALLAILLNGAETTTERFFDTAFERTTMGVGKAVHDQEQEPHPPSERSQSSREGDIP